MLDVRRSRAVARGFCRSKRTKFDEVGSDGAVRPASECNGCGNVRTARFDPLKGHGTALFGVHPATPYGIRPVRQRLSYGAARALPQPLRWSAIRRSDPRKVDGLPSWAPERLTQ